MPSCFRRPALRSWSARLAGFAVLLLVAAAPALAQDLIHYWNFNEPGAGSNPWPQPIAANVGSGTITYTFTGGVTNFGGTGINAQQGDGAGQAFAVQAGAGQTNNGRSFQLNVSTQGYENLTLAYATRGTGTGFNSQRAEFSVDGGATWTLIGTETGSTSANFYLVTYNLASFPAINDAPNVIIRFTLSGATSDSGNNRFDNITLKGTSTGGPGTGTGTGTVTVAPSLVQGGVAHDLAFTVTARSNTPTDVLTHVDFVLPEGFGPITADQVVTNPAGGSAQIVGQMVRVSGIAASQSQPVTITLQNLPVPDDSGQFTFGIRTGAGTDQTVLIAGQPMLRVWGTPEPITDVKVNNAQGVSLRLGEWVTVQGVVTVSDQFVTGTGEAGPSYIQDGTGGLGVFSPSGVAANVAIGDEVILFGRVDQFFGLNQLDSGTIVIQTVSTNEPVEPLVVTLADLLADGQGGVEVYEGRLVRVNGVTVNTTVWNVEGSGTNYQLSDGTGTLDVRVNPGVDFAGQPAPSGAFDVIAVVSQFRPSPPFIGGYQLMPRFASDIIDDSDAPLVTSPAPFETAATPNGITFTWTTDRPAHSEVRWTSTTTGASGVVVDEAPKTDHTLSVTGLDPATVYLVELRSAVGQDTTRIRDYPVVTRSAPGTTGVIRPVFNRDVDVSLADPNEAEVVNLRELLVDRINAANHSVDIALYSLSGTNGSLIANALIAAHNRGVAVRVIMDNSTAGTAPPQSLQTAGVPFITDSYGANSGQALHHNKFGVFDYKGGAPADIWVFNGSWNPTDPGTLTHYQNVVWIQDGAIAAAYTREFEQMWGSSTTTPNAATSRFGDRKRFTAPTTFWIGEGDTYVRLFFSPQGFGPWGSTEQQILAALSEAQHEVYLGLNLITRMSIVNVLQERFNAGVDVRGAVGDPNVTGSVFPQLAAFADVHVLPQSNPFGLLHHKYALVDALHPASAMTITGSHNWSRSANESNDENTLFLYSYDLTNQFVQEFAPRYRDAGGTALFPVSVEEVGGAAGVFSVSAPYPNPFTTSATFAYELPASGEVSVRVYDVMGREVQRVLDAAQPAGRYEVRFDATDLASGVYLLTVEAQAGGQVYRQAQRMTVVR